MTRIVMLRTKRGTEDGFSTGIFEAGACYDVRDNLAAYFLSSGYAERCEVEYVNVKWKSGTVTRSVMSDAIHRYIEHGVVTLLAEAA